MALFYDIIDGENEISDFIGDRNNRHTLEGYPVLSYSPDYICWTGWTLRNVLPKEWRSAVNQTNPFALDLSHTIIQNKDLLRLRNQENLRDLDLSNSSIGNSAVDLLLEMPWLESLHLEYCRISPNELKRFAVMPNLRKLSIGGNHFTDRNISVLAQFHSLKKLRINGNNRLNGKDWSFFNELPQLETVILSGCEYLTQQGFNALGSLKNLRNLLIQYCPRLNDSCLRFLDDLDSLRTLAFDGIRGGDRKNGITGRGLAPLGHHRHFIRLLLDDASEEIDDGDLSFLSKLTKLQQLDLSWTKSGKCNLTSLSPLIRLKWLSLGQNVTDEGLNVLADKNELEYLNLSQCCKISGNGLAAIARLPKLRLLKLPSRLRNGKSAAVLSASPSLEVFDFDDWEHKEDSNVTDNDLISVTGMTGLKKLCVFFQNTITDDGLKSLQNRPKLECFVLHHAKYITDDGLKTFLKLSELKKLSLVGIHNITGEGLKYLKNLTKLESLEIQSDPGNTALILRSLPDLPNMKTFTVSNSLTDEDAAELVRFPKLEKFLFNTSSQITDRGIACWKDLRCLKEIVLNGCPHITARSLAPLSDLPALAYLDISNNKQLDDDCATSLIKMKNLEVLSIRGTKLSRKTIALLHRELPDCVIDCFRTREIIGKIIVALIFIGIIAGFLHLHGIVKSLLMLLCPLGVLSVSALTLSVSHFAVEKFHLNEEIFIRTGLITQLQALGLMIFIWTGIAAKESTVHSILYLSGITLSVWFVIWTVLTVLIFSIVSCFGGSRK